MFEALGITIDRRPKRILNSVPSVQNFRVLNSKVMKNISN